MADHVCTHSPETDAIDAATTDELISTAAVCVWWQLTELLEVTGEGSVDFLQGVTTQDIAAIEIGTARYTLFLTNKARIIASALAYRVAEDSVLLEISPDHVEELMKHLKRYKLRAKCEVQHVDAGVVSVVGKTADEIGKGDGWYDTPAFGVLARTYVGSLTHAHELVCETLPAGGVQLADPETVDSIRIEHGVPSLSDMLADFMPAEVGGMDVAVALDKGCYLGQEPVARLHYRGKANRSLRQVTLSEEIPMEYGEADNFEGERYLSLRNDEDRALGTLTSWANSPRLGRIGLAVLRREIENGTHVTLADSPILVTPVDLK